MATAWTLHLTGHARLQVGGRELALDGLAAVLAARLALDGPQPRAELATLLWPDAEQARARANLRQRLLRLRQQAGVDWIVGDNVLALSDAVRLDADGDATLLHGVDLPQHDELSRWLDDARSRHRRQRLRALADEAHAAEAQGRWNDAVQAAQAQLVIDPRSEDLHRGLIRLHYLAGDGPRAHQAFQQLRQMLARDFGAGPSGETLALMRLVEQVPATPPAPAVSGARGAWDTALLRPPRLVGRDVERATVAAALADRRALLLLGEAGMGKSRLLSDTLPDAPGFVKVKAQAGDAGVPYATLARLLRGLVAAHALRTQPAALARLLPEIGPALPLPPGAERLLLQGAVEQVLAGSALRALVLDDLHFADDASVEMITALAGADALRDVAWIFTLRPGEGPAAAAALRDTLEESQRLETVVLRPLDAHQLAALVAGLGLPLDPVDTGQRLLRHSGGNPLFALETLKLMLRPDAAAGGLPQPAGVGALIDRRLRQLSDGALALARVAALAGPDFNPALAEQVLGRKAIELADAWAELEAAQVIRDNAFAHDLVLDAALRSVPAAIGRHLHAAVAAALEAAGGEAARIAGHWQRAGQDERALPWLQQAADLARQGLRRREEAAFASCAAEIVSRSGRDGAHALWLRAFEALEVTDGVEAALPALDRALAQAKDEAQRLQVLARRASAHTKRFELALAIRDGRQALDSALALHDVPTLADVLTVLTAALSMQGESDAAVQLLDRHWPLVETLSDPKPTPFIERGVLLDNVGRHADARQSLRRGIELALAQNWQSEAVVGYQNLAVSHLDTGELQQALALLDDGDRLRAAHDQLQAASVVGWDLRAIALRDLGRPAAALPLFERQIEHDEAQTPVRVPIMRLHRGWLWASIGQWARALQDILPQDRFADLPGWAWARALHLRARVAAARGGDVRQALQQAQAALGEGALAVVRDGIAIDLALAADAAQQAAARAALSALLDDAQATGRHATRWTAQWALARLHLQAGDAAQAAAHALACQQRLPEHVALNLLDGSWWHGLWRLWQQLGDAARSDAARAEGVAWIHRMLQRELDPAFHAAFRDAVPQHRELLTAR
jgi:DNA-binding SARP family transcriptional activator/tetratricopeptide (TPR) repeat protein